MTAESTDWPWSIPNIRFVRYSLWKSSEIGSYDLGIVIWWSSDVTTTTSKLSLRIRWLVNNCFDWLQQSNYVIWILMINFRNKCKIKNNLFIIEKSIFSNENHANWLSTVVIKVAFTVVIKHFIDVFILNDF